MDQIIRQKYQASLLNDQQWGRIIGFLVAHEELFTQLTLQSIYGRSHQLLIDGSEAWGVDFYPNGMEGMVTAPPVPGWILYREIASLQLYCRSSIPEVLKDLSQLGPLEWRSAESVLTIYAYRER